VRIGDMAAAAGVNVSTVRFYERKGLLRKPRRLSSGYRDYSTDALEVLRFIKHQKEGGFTLREIRGFLSIASRRGSPSEFGAALEEKVRSNERKMRALQESNDRLLKALEQCECGRGKSKCCIETLSNNVVSQ
jgi:DNA-binding transcriptional MerR regulator